MDRWMDGIDEFWISKLISEEMEASSWESWNVFVVGICWDGTFMPTEY